MSYGQPQYVTQGYGKGIVTHTVNEFIPTYVVRSDYLPTNNVSKQVDAPSQQWVTQILFSITNTKKKREEEESSLKNQLILIQQDIGQSESQKMFMSMNLSMKSNSAELDNIDDIYTNQYSLSIQSTNTNTYFNYHIRITYILYKYVFQYLLKHFIQIKHFIKIKSLLVYLNYTHLLFLSKVNKFNLCRKHMRMDEQERHRKTFSYKQPSFRINQKDGQKLRNNTLGNQSKQKCMSNRNRESNYSKQNGITKIYTDLTQQSLKKTYDLNNLKPFSTQNSLSQIYDELNSIQNPPINNPQKYTKTTSQLISASKIQKLINIIHKNTRFYKRKRNTDYSNLVQQKFIKTQIQDYDSQVAEHFINQMKKHTKNVNRIRSIISQIIQTNHTYYSIPKATNTLTQNIKSLKLNNKVVKQYEQEQPGFEKVRKRRRKNFSYNFDKNDTGIFCITKKRAYFQNISSHSKLNHEKLQKKVKVEQMPLKLRSNGIKSKIYYQKYLRKYSERKNLINNRIFKEQ